MTLQEHDVQLSSQHYTWQPMAQATIITVTNNDDNDVVKQYQHQHHLVELNNTSSDSHPNRHSVKALTLTFTTTPKTKGKQPHNTCQHMILSSGLQRTKVCKKGNAPDADAAASIVPTC